MPPVYGTINEFDPTKEDWMVYMERMRLYMTANSIAAAKRVPVFLSVIGGNNYSILRDLVSPDDPSTATLEDLASTLSAHFSPKRSVIAERFKFLRYKQAKDDDISSYVVNLNRLARTCDYGEILESALRDKFVEGLYDVKIQQELLKKLEISFKDAVRFAKACELTANASRQLHSPTTEEVHAMSFNKQRKPVQGSRQKNYSKEGTTRSQKNEEKFCYRCKGNNHLANNCRFKKYKCNKCNVMGHIARACRSSVNKVNDTVIEEFQLYAISDRKSNDAYNVTIKLNDVPIIMEIDTGAGLSVMS